jgi:membrane associated rhomboid family serine protease
MLPLADTARRKGPALITRALITANVAVFAWQVWLALNGDGSALAMFMGEHALVAQHIMREPFAEAQWRTVLAHMFLHGGVVHLLGNMWFLWIFGANVEGRVGALRYLALYLLAGLAAATTQVAAAPSSIVPMIGASGAISGVLGAYLLLFPTAFVWTLIPWIVPIVPVPAVVFLVFWFVLQAYNGIGSLQHHASDAGGVAWWAHAGGFVAGAALTFWAKRNRWIRKG